MNLWTCNSIVMPFVTLLLLFSATEIFSEKPTSEYTNNLDARELAYYKTWLGDRIYGVRPSNDALPPARTICGGNGLFFCAKMLDGDNYRISVSFVARTNGPESFMRLLKQFDRESYRVQYTVPINGIFPILGSLYCLDRPQGNQPSAIRVSDNDIPNNMLLRRHNIIIPIWDKPNLIKQPEGSCIYNKTMVCVVGYNTAHDSSPRVQLKLYPVGRPEPDEKWYQVGDHIHFNTVSHIIVNIVLPDQFDSQIIDRKNEDGTITRLSSAVTGWMELAPNPVAVPARWSVMADDF